MLKSDHKEQPTKTAAEPLVFYKTPHLLVYTCFCVLGSLPLLLISLPLGLSVADDVVFGFFVIAGGMMGDALFRKTFRKAMYFVGSIPMAWLWPVIRLIVMILQPLVASWSETSQDGRAAMKALMTCSASAILMVVLSGQVAWAQEYTRVPNLPRVRRTKRAILPGSAQCHQCHRRIRSNVLHLPVCH